MKTWYFKINNTKENGKIYMENMQKLGNMSHKFWFFKKEIVFLFLITEKFKKTF